jgi:hypothetical protein
MSDPSIPRTSASLARRLRPDGRRRSPVAKLYLGAATAADAFALRQSLKEARDPEAVLLEATRDLGMDPKIVRREAARASIGWPDDEPLNKGKVG